MKCPTCEGSGEVLGDGDFAPGLAQALHSTSTGAGISRLERPCSMCVVIEYATPGPHRDALVLAAEGRISVRALHESLRQIGVRISRGSIMTHRNEAHGQ